MEKRNQQITTLLKESHHRIRTIFRPLPGLTTMQLQQTSDPATANLILDNLTRIRSISLVHQLLSQEDVRFVNLVPLMRKVMEMVLQVSNSSHKNFLYEIHGEDVKVSSRKATSLALVINELTTNSIKHGFASAESGTIMIRLLPEADSRIVLEFTDNGRGLPEGSALSAIRAWGSNLSQTWCRTI